MEEVTSGIFLWTWFSQPHGYNFNGHLLTHESGNLCIDPVEPSAEVLEAVSRQGVATILLTNRNHVRASNLVRSGTGAQTVIHAADAAYARGQGAVIDRELAIGDRVGPLVVVDASGKSPGEIALYWPERKLLIVGDSVIGNPPGQCGFLNEKVMDNPPRLRESVRGLLTLDFETLLVGDGVPILQGGKSRLIELVRGFPN